MQPDPPLVREWFQKAHNDLESARRLLQHDPILDTGCFHCQQVVEKLLKGLLRWHGVEAPKVHTLGLLFDLSEQHEVLVAQLRDSCEWLTRFAVDTRYPHGRDPSLAKAREALQAAENAYRVVLNLVPAEVHP